MMIMLMAIAMQQPVHRATPGPRFEISFPAGAHAGPITGRAYVAVTRDSSRRSPIDQTGETGVPLFGVNIDALAPGKPAIIDAKTFGHPVQSLRDLPAGDYWVEPFINVYTRFPRADGHVVWLHMDQWEGQDWKRSPGNIAGKPVRIHWNPASSVPIRLVADQVIPPITPPADDASVKHLKFKSTILSNWWGQPIYLGATVLLPKGFDAHPDAHYPIVYDEGHFSLGAPGGYGRNAAFTKYWDSDTAPRILLVTIQHPSPYYDDSYGVNSANNGPYGDALTQELLPMVEKQFRALGQPWARLLTGGSTGGWISLAKQVMYPDLYGGTWSLCPDGVDFRAFQIVNVYQDSNAYWVDHGWMKVERPDVRRPDGNITTMMKDENWYELTVGDHSRSGGQWDIWEATYSPVGADGYPQRIWDKTTGVIHHDVAAYWKAHYDLRSILASNWATLGPRVADKINVYVGDADSYFLNDGVHFLHDFLVTTKSPSWNGEIVFQPMAPHCWGPPLTDLLPKMVRQVEHNAPGGADLKSWRY
ncbi:MAG TPA: alpha/beta hydrolase-fold protein [Gemmatimonadales bacterium]|jgi:hypothetical protein